MSNIILHSETPLSGVVVVEYLSQHRTVQLQPYNYSNSYDMFLRQSQYHNLLFPNVIQIIQYTKDKNDYIYHGLDGNGLRVLFSKEKIKDLKDATFGSIFDPFSGLVCTDHNYDGKSFKSIKELISCVSGLWWGATHNIDFRDLESWKRDKLFESSFYLYKQGIPLNRFLKEFGNIEYKIIKK